MAKLPEPVAELFSRLLNSDVNVSFGVDGDPYLEFVWQQETVRLSWGDSYKVTTTHVTLEQAVSDVLEHFPSYVPPSPSWYIQFIKAAKQNSNILHVETIHQEGVDTLLISTSNVMNYKVVAYKYEDVSIFRCPIDHKGKYQITTDPSEVLKFIMSLR